RYRCVQQPGESQQPLEGGSVVVSLLDRWVSLNDMLSLPDHKFVASLAPSLNLLPGEVSADWLCGNCSLHRCCAKCHVLSLAAAGASVNSGQFVLIRRRSTGILPQSYDHPGTSQSHR